LVVSLTTTTCIGCVSLRQAYRQSLVVIEVESRRHVPLLRYYIIDLFFFLYFRMKHNLSLTTFEKILLNCYKILPNW
jgi:hypothetical protein